jgi:hypothetical protein
MKYAIETGSGAMICIPSFLRLVEAFKSWYSFHCKNNKTLAASHLDKLHSSVIDAKTLPKISNLSWPFIFQDNSNKRNFVLILNKMKHDINTWQCILYSGTVFSPFSSLINFKGWREFILKAFHCICYCAPDGFTVYMYIFLLKSLNIL